MIFETWKPIIWYKSKQIRELIGHYVSLGKTAMIFPGSKPISKITPDQFVLIAENLRKWNKDILILPCFVHGETDRGRFFILINSIIIGVNPAEVWDMYQQYTISFTKECKKSNPDHEFLKNIKYMYEDAVHFKEKIEEHYEIKLPWLLSEILE